MSSENLPPPSGGRTPADNAPTGTPGAQGTDMVVGAGGAPVPPTRGVPGNPTGAGDPARDLDARSRATSLGPATNAGGSSEPDKPAGWISPSAEDVLEHGGGPRVAGEADSLAAAGAAIDQGAISESPLSGTALPSFSGEPVMSPPSSGEAQGSGSAEPAEGWDSVSSQWREVVDQVRELGMRLGSAMRTGWSTAQPDEMAGLPNELRATADRLDAALRAAREEAAADQTREQLRQATETAQQAGETLLGEVRHATAAGLRTLNEQLAAVVDRLDGERERKR